mgnify:CR=1 FL=1
MDEKRRRYRRFASAMKTTRETFEPHWRELTEFIQPYRAQFDRTDVNKGTKKYTKIINSTASLALRSIMAGMMGGVTSPSRQWLRLSLQDFTLAEGGEEKIWLEDVTKRMGTLLSRSNLYNVLPNVYGDAAMVGTSAIFVDDEDADDVLRSYSLPVGSYFIMCDARGKVNGFYREMTLTLRKVVEQFGTENLSRTLKDKWESENGKDQEVTICHIVVPNDEYNSQSKFSKKYTSVYYESSGNNDVMLREKGYDYFPVLCLRWNMNTGDTYGTDCPGMAALGDIKALQKMEKHKAQAIEKLVNPPMTGPESLKRTALSVVAGAMTYADERNDQKGLRPIYEVSPHIMELSNGIREHELRIKRAFYEDLFLMMVTSDRREMTAREVDERHEEKMWMLGSVLERINTDLLSPLVEIVFNAMLKRDLIPSAPESIAGANLNIEFVSILHHAQKAGSLAGIERLLTFATNTMQLDPEVVDKLDRDQMVDEYAEILGSPPRAIRSDAQVAEIRSQRRQAQAAQHQMQSMQQQTEMMKNVASATTGDNEVTKALGEGRT